MIGTEKQIAWAEDIKANFLRIAEEYARDKEFEAAIYAEKAEAAETDSRVARCTRHEQAARQEAAIARELAEYYAENEDRASFWIDRRDDFWVLPLGKYDKNPYTVDGLERNINNMFGINGRQKMLDRINAKNAAANNGGNKNGQE